MDNVKDTAFYNTTHVTDSFFTLKFDLSGVDPGFYQVNLSWNNETGSGTYPVFNIGVDPEKIISPQDKREDTRADAMRVTEGGSGPSDGAAGRSSGERPGRN